GMKEIIPEAIPELKIMPWLIALMIVMALATAATGSRTMLTIWMVSFVLLLLVGLVDFWLWEYDYGHNLDLDKAAIKVPGMSYQPPPYRFETAPQLQSPFLATHRRMGCRPLLLHGHVPVVERTEDPGQRRRCCRSGRPVAGGLHLRP
ncbi:MAG: hypothetical protein O2899_04895, partial [Bacteroidetes bacterium]|nr:hypothetical protein [Bacteroidota bacterium]